MDRSEKKDVVTRLHQTFAESELVVITRPVGLTVAESTVLRRRMLEAGAGFRVTKNRLARRALEGTQFETLADLFTGPTAIAYSKDPIAAAKVAVGYAKENEKLTVIGGAMGSQMLGLDGIMALAALPSLDELRAKLAGLMQRPATLVASVLQAPAAQLARVFSAYATKSDAA
ncbi:MAG: 50S ribosomal protein L10 [Dongiaceae bacterium]